jgi:hypothetical protein
LGFTLGAREMAQQADGFLYRSEWELSHARQVAAKDKEEAGKWLEMARRDIEKSRKLYEPLLGFANVSASLEQVYTDRNEQIQLAKASLETPVTPVTSKPSHAARRPAAKTAKRTTGRRQLGQPGRQPWR